jgi:hypothetical protein
MTRENTSGGSGYDGLVMSLAFHWTTFDLASRLPGTWRHEIAAVAVEADFREFPRTPILSRESQDVEHIFRGRVDAADVRQYLPWLYRLYRERFLELARDACAEPVVAARDDRYGIVLNVQRGTEMRFECHVDSNPLTGLLFCTDHPAGAGGELVFAHDPEAADVDTIERDCSVIRPQAGHLIFFDGREHPHYARPLLSRSDVRIVAVMNFYTESFPESTRPRELNHHLFGQALAGLPGWNVGHGQRAADRGAAEDSVPSVPGVEDGGLALGYAAGGLMQAEAQVAFVEPGGAGVDLAVGAELDQAVSRLGGRRGAGPDRAGGGDLGDVEILGGTDGDRPGHGLDVQDVARPAVGGGGAHAQAAALADGEGVGAFVLAEDGAGLVDDRAGGVAQVAGQESLGVAVGDEADVVAVGLVGHG